MKTLFKFWTVCMIQNNCTPLRDRQHASVQEIHFRLAEIVEFPESFY